MLCNHQLILSRDMTCCKFLNESVKSLISINLSVSSNNFECWHISLLSIVYSAAKVFLTVHVIQSMIGDLKNGMIVTASYSYG